MPGIRNKRYQIHFELGGMEATSLPTGDPVIAAGYLDAIRQQGLEVARITVSYTEVKDGPGGPSCSSRHCTISEDGLRQEAGQKPERQASKRPA